MEKHPTERKFVRIKQKGQVTLPSGMRKALGLQEGDLVEVSCTGDGLLITRQEVVAMHALDEIGRVLREKGITLEDLIASGRESRRALIKEHANTMADRKANNQQPPLGRGAAPANAPHQELTPNGGEP